MFLLTATDYQLVFTSCLQTLTPTYCTHLLTYHMLITPYSQFLRLRRFCSDDSDFTSKSDVMYKSFKDLDFSDSVVVIGRIRAQAIDPGTAL